jgi:hypothetical protein
MCVDCLRAENERLTKELANAETANRALTMAANELEKVRRERDEADLILKRVVAERDQLREQLAEARNVLGEAYQMAGALGASVEAMDNLLAASEGDPLPHETFLPHPGTGWPEPEPLTETRAL